MITLPTKGLCTGIFLLCYSLRQRGVSTVDDWVASASSKSTYMAASLNLRRISHFLIDAGLAVMSSPISIDRRLRGLDGIADISTLKGIASVIIQSSPPNWIDSIFLDGKILIELIPESDLRQIDWLGPDLEPMLASVFFARQSTRNEAILKRLGDAGEEYLVTRFAQSGSYVRHVARISDHFGYDIEETRAMRTAHIEVKSCVQSTSSRFFLSRNEYNTAKRLGASWVLMQVIFTSEIFLKNVIRSSDVVGLRSLDASKIVSYGSIDSENCKWVESIEIKPLDIDWCTLLPHAIPDFSFGFNVP